MSSNPSRCVPCESGAVKLRMEQLISLLKHLESWQIQEEPVQALVRSFSFKNFHETMAFVNAVAWIAHRHDHHPGLEVGYKTCKVTYTTHAIGGLSENDFICAAAVNELTGN
jgi:4a-hydroxytetrahydrobiopterin dehydratase